MTLWLLIAAISLVGMVISTILVVRWRDPNSLPHRITPSAQRILFPFIGQAVSRSVLDATLRLAHAEKATLIPAYIVTVPFDLSLEAPIPSRCEQALPLLEAIEQRAAWLGVPTDTRIETGRSPLHALERLVQEQRFDRLVVPAASRTSEGFTPDDVAWLLANAPGEILVLRPKSEKANGAATYV